MNATAIAVVIALYLAAAATVVAAWLRPWRMCGSACPPWPWWGLWPALPFLWSADLWSGQAATPLVSGAVLSVLLAGWPLTMLALAAAAVLTAMSTAGSAAADGTLLPVVAVLARWFWLGALPASLALAIGALVRRWWAGQPFGYVLGRAFGGTLAALWLTALAAMACGAAAGAGAPGVAAAEGQPAPWLMTGFVEACLTGLVVTWAVARRPAWVATWRDRLYGLSRG